MNQQMYQKKISLRINTPLEGELQATNAPSPMDDYQIQLQVTDGWAITGSYRDQTLTTVTLQKRSSPEDR